MNILNRFYNYTKNVHRITAFSASSTGFLIAMANSIDKYNIKENNILYQVFLSVPEGIFGGVCGYFWMYTLIPFSFYKFGKHKNVKKC